ncbi:MAG: hypothetical protein ACXAEN_19405 [Candidatus Thorarchaeota archaeon]|jgi:hypothetical protein
MNTKENVDRAERLLKEIEEHHVNFAFFTIIDRDVLLLRIGKVLQNAYEDGQENGNIDALKVVKWITGADKVCQPSETT